MEVQQLRDYVAYAEKRVDEDEETVRKEESKAKTKLNKMSQNQVVGAIKEFLNWKYRREGKKQRYDLNK